ncbi:MAG: polysaccharide biosynthesis protein, partial [Clostridia bacterium]|nr:polysaccharide biosynthesis protein [Clostridia bacterium]
MATGKSRKLEHWKLVAILLAVCDFITIHLVYFLSLMIRFDFRYSAIPKDYLYRYFYIITPYAAVSIVIFALFRMYRGMWRFASLGEFVKTALGSVVASFLHMFFISVIFGNMPASYHLGGMLLQFVFLVAPRFAFRFLLFIRSALKEPEKASGRVMIIGAGEAGQQILRDVKASVKLNDKVVCFIDDNSNKWNRYIEGVPIAGGRDDILASVGKYKVSKIYIAIPSAHAEDKRDIINICKETGCELKQLPGMYQLLTGQVTVSALREVAIEDLLGREPIKADMKEVFDFVNGKVVLVTGGGGSIGSELCRQVAAHCPKQLIIFDVYENNAYALQLELKHNYPNLKLEVLIGSVRDSRRMFEVFSEYRPQIVYHAAAHKHVPLMEDSPCEAIKNNAIGTYKTAYAAMVHGCERFVLISTDKAVNPTNIMGASKRLCEMIIQAFDAKIKAGEASRIPQLFTHTKNDKPASPEEEKALFDNVRTEFVAVRFGNVLGSNGSVIPIFK